MYSLGSILEADCHLERSVRQALSASKQAGLNEQQPRSVLSACTGHLQLQRCRVCMIREIAATSAEPGERRGKGTMYTSCRHEQLHLRLDGLCLGCLLAGHMVQNRGDHHSQRVHDKGLGRGRGCTVSSCTCTHAATVHWAVMILGMHLKLHRAFCAIDWGQALAGDW